MNGRTKKTNTDEKNKEPKVLTKDQFDEMLTLSYQGIQAKSNFLLKSLNIRESGTIVEDFIKNQFTQMFNSRFRVTSGYIVNVQEKTGDFILSPQVDLIIIDTLVPNILFPQPEFTDKTEYVPIEAVVGIFEIKKTLDSDSSKKALQHIKKIKESVGVRKNNTEQYVLGGKPTAVIKMIVERDDRLRDPYIEEYRKIRTGIFSNPITGIIGLEHKGRDLKYDPNNFVDIAFSFDGFLQALVHKSKGYFHTLPIIDPRNYEYKALKKLPQNIKTAFSLLTDYLYQTTGTCFNPSKYYGD